MPALEFICAHCGQFTVWQSIADLHPERCPTCGSQDIRRDWGLGGLIFK